MSICAVCVRSNIFSEINGQLKLNFMWNLHGIEEESLFKWSRSCVVLHYCQPLGEEVRGAVAFSRDFTIICLCSAGRLGEL